MKKNLSCLLVLILLILLLTACGEKIPAVPAEMTLDENFVIVCTEDPVIQQAAISLQSNLKHAHGLALELATAAPAEGKTITVSVDSSLEDGQYRTRLTGGGIVIEAQNPQVMTLAMRSICANWPAGKLTSDSCSILSGYYPLEEAPFLLLTQNIRYTDDEGGNLVVQRAPRFNQLVEQYQPDILCMQEDNYLWDSILESFFGDRYGFHGMYGDGPDVRGGKGGNKQQILYRTDRYELLEKGGFWLSETPEKASKLATSKGMRTCTWVLLKDKLTQQTLFVCNAHLDNIKDDEVRLTQLRILFEQVGSYMEKYPTVFCGDFNARPDSVIYAEATKIFLDPHMTANAKPNFTEYTFTRYGTTQPGTDDEPRRLDYLFYNDQLIAQMYRILTDQYDGYISDHYGVMTEYSFAK